MLIAALPLGHPGNVLLPQKLHSPKRGFVTPLIIKLLSVTQDTRFLPLSLSALQYSTDSQAKLPKVQARDTTWEDAEYRWR